MQQYRVAVTDDNSVNRQTFIQKLSALPELELIFVAVNGHDCMEQLKGLPTQRIPDVIFMDLEMPGLGGIETIRLCHGLYPAIHFIVLTVFDEEEKIFEAIRAGASGYLLKNETAEGLGEAVRDVLEYGGAPMSPPIARKALQLMSRSAMPEQTAGNPVPETITGREEEVLRLLVSGRDAKKIASELDITVATVRKHIANIYDKLHVQSRAEIISMAHHNRWFNR